MCEERTAIRLHSPHVLSPSHIDGLRVLWPFVALAQCTVRHNNKNNCTGHIHGRERSIAAPVPRCSRLIQLSMSVQLSMSERRCDKAVSPRSHNPFPNHSSSSEPKGLPKVQAPEHENGIFFLSHHLSRCCLAERTPQVNACGGANMPPPPRPHKTATSA